MLTVAIDIGRYSIKFMITELERKSVRVISVKEVPIDPEDLTENQSLQTLQIQAIKNFLAQIEEDYQLFMTVPPDIISTRFVEVPVANKRKAAMMIPFQLEDEIPFTLAQAHLGIKTFSKNDKTSAIVHISKKEIFEEYFRSIVGNEIEPRILTSEVSIIQSYVKNSSKIFPQSFCILDIGDETTNAYFFNEKELVSNHTSYIAGHTITEAISKNYGISENEALIYKHQNAFFLTKDQYDQVNEKQKVFAQLMDKTISGLINEFRRWELGHRVVHGYQVDKVYLMGGASNIKNIDRYLSSQIAISCEYLTTHEGLNDVKMDQDTKQKTKFSKVAMLSLASSYRSDLINLLTGDFSIQSKIDLPLHSLAFVGSRAMILSFIICFGVILNMLGLNSQREKLDRSVSSIIKNPSLNISNRIKRQYRKRPLALKRSLEKKLTLVSQKVQSLQASTSTNALISLRELTGITREADVELVQFSAVSQANFSMIFKAQKLDSLTKLQKEITSLAFKDLFIDLNDKDLSLTITGEI